MRRGAARQPVGADEVGGENILDNLVLGLVERREPFILDPFLALERIGPDVGEGQTGIVDQAMKTAERVVRRGDYPVAIFGLADIGGKAMDLAGVAGARRLEFGKVIADMGGRNDVRTRFAERFGHDAPDTTAGACDNDDATVE
jgi:hypothetical protein